jgi:hypothetical protein
MSLRRELALATSARDEAQLAKSRLEYLVQQLQGHEDALLPADKDTRAEGLGRHLIVLLQQHMRDLPQPALSAALAAPPHRTPSHAGAHSPSDSSLIASQQTLQSADVLATPMPSRDYGESLRGQAPTDTDDEVVLDLTSPWDQPDADAVPFTEQLR